MSKKIKLSRNKITIVDLQDFVWLSQFKWHFSGGYAVRVQNVKNGEVDSCYRAKTLYMHKEILKRKYGKIVEASKGDHINTDKLDNRRDNLRLATNAENCRNSVKQDGNYSSEYKGVSWYKKYNKWRARITFEGKAYLLGYYKEEMDAALAYDLGAIYYFGKFALTNFPKHIRKKYLRVHTVNYDYRKETKTSKYKYVRRDMRYDSKFYAEVFVFGKTEFLGVFDNEMDAAKEANKFILKNKLPKKINVFRKIEL